jgi:hypothetical protein
MMALMLWSSLSEMVILNGTYSHSTLISTVVCYHETDIITRKPFLEECGLKRIKKVVVFGDWLPQRFIRLNKLDDTYGVFAASLVMPSGTFNYYVSLAS